MSNRILVIGILLLNFFPKSFAQTNIGDDGLANAATLEFPSGIAIDSKGNVYIAERRGCRIRKVDFQTGIITTIAGIGEQGFSGDGGPANKAKIKHPELISIDSQDNIIITDRGNSRIRKIDTKSGIITTIAGNGKVGYRGDGGPATEARLSYPFGVLIAPNDDIYIADTENHVVRKVDAKTGIITTVAGNGKGTFGGDGGLATDASLQRPHNFVFDEVGNLIIGDSENQRIRSVDLETQKIETLYGKGDRGFSEDSTPGNLAKFGYFGSFILYKGQLGFTGWINKRIRTIDPQTGLLNSITNDQGRPIEIHGPYGMALHGSQLFVVEANKNRVLKIDLETGQVEHFAGK